jgi:TPR repeat protein
MASCFVTSLELELEWWKIRDLLFGENFVSRDVCSALRLASSCRHPDAQWLVSTTAGKDVADVSSLQRLFSPSPSHDDARSLFFAWKLFAVPEFSEQSPKELAFLERSASLGYARAKCDLAEVRHDFAMAEDAALSGERNAWWLLALFYQEGKNCEKSFEKAKNASLRAAQFGLVDGMLRYARLLGDSDYPEVWKWRGKAAAHGQCAWFLSKFEDKLNRTKNDALIYAIGCALDGHIDVEAKLIFKKTFLLNGKYQAGLNAVQFYRKQNAACRKAIDLWSMIARRRGVVKDIRILIGKLIWGDREEAKYKIG